MTRLAITGHRGLSGNTARLVESALWDEIGDCDAAELVGLSCLADGADTLFARMVLQRGGKLTVVVPAAEYRAGLPVQHHAAYDHLLARAGSVVRLGHQESSPEAHMAAGLRLLEEADRLIAVWDGMPSRGYGGTADVVEAARDRGIPVTVLWPDGARRD